MTRKRGDRKRDDQTPTQPKKTTAPPRRAEVVPESPGPLLWVCFGLIAIIAVVYAPVLDFGFVKYDDPQYVSANPHVFGGVTLQGISWALTSGYAVNWHPL